MSKLQFFKCMHCGNVAVKVFDKGVPLMCCGEKMQLLEAGVTDAAQEKHVPVVTQSDVIHVEVGSVAHPMEEEHYITMIVLETTKGFQVKQLNPGEAPAADFTVAPPPTMATSYIPDGGTTGKEDMFAFFLLDLFRFLDMPT